MSRPIEVQFGELAAILRQRIPSWRDSQLAWSRLDGGLTNRNYRVDVDGLPYVVRIEGDAQELLAIDRENEWHNTNVAASRGLAARLIFRDPGNSLSVREFLPGRAMQAAELRRVGMPTRLGVLLVRLNSGPAFRAEFDLLDRAAHFAGRLRRLAVALPFDFSDRLAAVERLKRILSRDEVVRMPCHNDLVAENIIEHEQGFRLIDFEYSGNNDPCFELGNLCCELEFDDAQLDELCQAYFGAPTEQQLARVRLQRIVSDVGWSLWALLQEHASAVEFDFAAYGRRRWERAAALLSSPDFAGWVAAI